MELIDQFLPITALIAIALFVIKELVEFFKRSRERVRKIAALKILLSEELEKNHWAFKQLFSAMAALNPNNDEYFSSQQFSLHVTREGKEHMRVRRDENEDLESNHPLLKFRFEMYERLLPSLAEVDAKLFHSVKNTYENLIELAHFRQTLTTWLAGESLFDAEMTRDFLANFVDRKDKYFEKLESGYRALKGEPLKSFKLR